MSTHQGPTRGVILLAAGNACYGQYAINFAASLLQADQNVKIALFASINIITGLTPTQRRYFDRILPVPEHALYVDGIPYYNRFKLFLPQLSPYDETFYFDADSLWVSKHPITRLFDFMRAHGAELGGQCEAIVPVRPSAVLFKGIKDIKPLQDFHPSLSFVGKNFYQLHGQCVYATKTTKSLEVFEQARQIFDALLHRKLTCSTYWVWHGQPIEELALSLATAMVPLQIPVEVAKFAPVSVQSDKLTHIDPYSDKKFIISINGYGTQEEATRVGGYCMGEDVTALYIAHYNRKIAELEAAGYDVMAYCPKIVEL